VKALIYVGIDINLVWWEIKFYFVTLDEEKPNKNTARSSPRVAFICLRLESRTFMFLILTLGKFILFFMIKLHKKETF
jgi:hypothetical protein